MNGNYVCRWPGWRARRRRGGEAGARTTTTFQHYFYLCYSSTPLHSHRLISTATGAGVATDSSSPSSLGGAVADGCWSTASPSETGAGRATVGGAVDGAVVGAPVGAGVGRTRAGAAARTPAPRSTAPSVSISPSSSPSCCELPWPSFPWSPAGWRDQRVTVKIKVSKRGSCLVERT